MSDVEFPEWHTSESSTPNSPYSDFAELFSQIATTDQNRAASWDWLNFDNLSKPALSELEVKDVPVAIIKPSQEPAEAILPEVVPVADHQGPVEATPPEIIHDADPQESAEGSAEIIPEIDPQEPPRATSPKVVHEAGQIFGEKPHHKENLVKGFLIQTGPRKECNEKPLVIDLTGSDLASSEIPSCQPKDGGNDVIDSLSMNDDEPLMEGVNGRNQSPKTVPLSTERKRKRPTSASSGSGRRSRRKTTVQDYVGTDRLFTNNALKEVDDLIKAERKHSEDRMRGLKALRSHILSHGALEEEVTKEWEQSR